MKEFNKIEYIKERELIPEYTNQKSFYNKAILKKYYNKFNILLKVELYSYNTLVCTIQDNKYILNDNIDVKLLFSNTTLKHIKELLKQYYYTLHFNIKTKADIIKYNNTSIY